MEDCTHGGSVKATLRYSFPPTTSCTIQWRRPCHSSGLPGGVQRSLPISSPTLPDSHVVSHEEKRPCTKETDRNGKQLGGSATQTRRRKHLKKKKNEGAVEYSVCQQEQNSMKKERRSWKIKLKKSTREYNKQETVKKEHIFFRKSE